MRWTFVKFMGIIVPKPLILNLFEIRESEVCVLQVKNCCKLVKELEEIDFY